jgi:tetratricopeptide (TPR) repeat protein
MWLAGLVSVVVYIPSLSNGFALDDIGDIVDNTTVHDLHHVGKIVSSPYRSDVPPAGSPWRPLTSLSFALSWSVGSGSPLSFHVLNVALHAADTALVVLLLAALGASPVPSLIGGLLFAVHPVHVEAVANDVGRGDTLMALFVLLGALAYLRTHRRRWMRIAAVGSCYALALATKENGVALPALLVGMALLAPAAMDGASPERSSAEGSVAARLSEAADATERRPHSRARLLTDWPLFAVLAAVLLGYLALRYQVLGALVHHDAAPYIVVLPAATRIETAVANFTEVTRLLLWPVDLVADYGPAVIVPATLASIRFWAGVAVALGFGALAVLDLKRGRWIALGVVWVALSQAVVSDLAFPVGIWVSERTLYLPSVGVAFLAVGAWGWLKAGTSRQGRRSGLAVAALLVLLGGVRTWSRSATWASDETVFRTLAREHPESYRAQWWMGRQLLEAGRLDAALTWLQRATETSPNDLQVRLGWVRALLLAKRSQEAYDAVSHMPPLDPARDVYLTQSLIQLGRPDEARAAVRAGLARFPSDARLAEQARELGVPAPGGRRPPR